MSKRFQVPWTDSYDNVLADPQVDAVLIATPTPLHAAMIKKAAASGKHIYCEKPLSLDIARAADAVAAARSTAVKLQVGFQRRFDPDFRLVKARIDDGTVGDIRFFRATCRDMRAPSLDYLRNCGGIFADVTLHDFDIARWLVGEIVEVYACGAALSDPAIAQIASDVDNAVVVAKFANGAIGVIDNSRESVYGYETSLEVMGSRATIRVGQSAQRVSHVEMLREAARSSDIGTDFVTRFAAGYVAAVDAFVAAIVDNTAAWPTGEDAMAAFVLAQTAQRSMASNRPVLVPELTTAVDQ
jgi:myo-inositol 2-dehydrogenase/D-chiro-inositol 1-dehydrogenase